MSASLPQRLAVGTALIVLVIAYGFFPGVTMRSEPIKFNSPDEAANYFFSVRLSQADWFRAPERLSLASGNLIHPRSTQVVAGSVVPGGFLGLPLVYGALGLTIGAGVLPFLSPLAALSLVVACGLVWRRLVAREAALWASALLAVHPAVWYYASRGFYHNILFASTLALAVLAYVRFRDEAHRPAWLVVAVFLLAVALVVRTSEILWVGPLAAAAVFTDRRAWRSAQAISALIAFGLAAITAAYLNVVTYGGIFPPGYVAVETLAGIHPRLWWSALMGLVLPFGFNPQAIAEHIWRYGIVPFWPYGVLAFAGAWTARGRRLPRWYLYGSLWITGWLFVYYGSWELNSTNLALGSTLGASYVRYWIPAYIVWLPYAALALVTIGDWAPGRCRRVVLVAVVLAIGFTSFGQVFFEPNEGLFTVALRLGEYRAASQTLQRLTPTDAIIIGDRVDKVAFPERRVIVSDGRPVLTIPEVQAVLPTLAEYAPLYFATVTVPEIGLREALTRQRFRLVAPTALPDRSWLWRLVRS